MSTFTYPRNARQLPPRYSPLSNSMVAAGHYYDPRTGLVKPIPTPTDETSNSLRLASVGR